MGPRGYSEKFYSDARKFDSGGQANPILIPMLCAAMEEVALIDTQEAQETLDRRHLLLRSASSPMLILVLDEIDQLETRDNNVLYTVFAWAHRKLSLIHI